MATHVKNSHQYSIALAGQPNTGKTTLFNALTGSNQHVGNWPGKTVEQKAGVCRRPQGDLTVVDLPGTYSLTANSIEELIARNYIIDEQPDAVILLVDASQLERTFYMVAETIMMDVPLVVALNMIDVAEDNHITVSAEALAEKTGIPVVALAASKGRGIETLLDTVESVLRSSTGATPKRPVYEGTYAVAAEKIERVLSGAQFQRYPASWTALKLLERDSQVTATVKAALSDQYRQKIEQELPDARRGATWAAEQRYRWIQMVIGDGNNGRPPTPRSLPAFDRAATHPLWGPFIAIGIVLAAIVLSLLLGGPFMFGALRLIRPFASVVERVLAFLPPLALEAITGGFIPGTGYALSMCVFMAAAYFVIALLEDIGYMARVGFVFDRFMQKMGLHGKTVMPLCMSLVCNISGTLGARVVDSWKQRMLTIIIAGTMPCLAIWAVTSFLSVIFFGPRAALIIPIMICAIVAQLFLASLLVRKTVLKGGECTLVMELPPYHKPNWNAVSRYVWTHVVSFLKKGGTLIAASAVLIWFLSYFPDGNMETSLLARIGKTFAPIGSLMGMDWKLLVCLMVGFISKEAVLASMAVLYGLAEGEGATIISMMLGCTSFDHGQLGQVLAANISPAAGLAFVFAILFSFPCLATVSAMYSEFKSLKWTAGTFLFYVATSLAYGTLMYNVGRVIF